MKALLIVLLALMVSSAFSQSSDLRYWREPIDRIFYKESVPPSGAIINKNEYGDISYSRDTLYTSLLLWVYEHPQEFSEAYARTQSWIYRFTHLNTSAKIIIGMKDSQVLFLLGPPEKKNVSVGTWGNHEQWIYDDTYLYFENGILTSYQTSK